MADDNTPVTPEQKIVFGLSPDGTGDGVPLLLLAVTPGGWEYMKDGKTHHFDLTSVGIPVKLMMFGASDRAGAVKFIEDHNNRIGAASLHLPKHDFGIKPRQR